MQCFDTFRGFLHKLYAVTVDGKGREGTYNFFLTTTGGQGQHRIRHRVQLPHGDATSSVVPNKKISHRGVVQF